MAKSPTLLTPEEAISLAVEWQPSEKNETDNHISVTFFLFSPAPVPERICLPLLLLQYFEKTNLLLIRRMDDVITWMDDVDFIVTEKESNNPWIVCRKLLPLKSTRN